MYKMNKIAFMFPGQGSQYLGMGKEFYDSFKVYRETIDYADKLLDFNLLNLLFEENNEINITEYTQPALLAVSVGILRILLENNIVSDVNAGLSLGEYGALVASGIMDFDTALKIVRKRGIYMQQEVKPGCGKMAAVLGMDTELIEEICKNISEEFGDDFKNIVEIANYNCKGQVVISGETNLVDKAANILKEAGAKKVITLNVSGPFHSKMLIGAGKKLGSELKNIKLNPINTPYFSNVTGQVVNTTREIKELLTKQVYSSVRWQQIIENMSKMDINTFIEVGPGKTLSSFVRKINKEATVLNIEKPSDLHKIMEWRKEC